MKKRHLFIVTALVGVSLLMLAPVAYAGGSGGGTVVNAEEAAARKASGA